MKNFFTLKNIVLLGAVVFGLVAFFLSFAANLTTTIDGARGTMKNIVWGCNLFVSEGHVEVPPYKIGPSVLTMIGFILILVGILGAAGIGLFLQKPWAKWIVVACAAVALVGSVFTFIYVGPFARAFTDAMFKAQGLHPTQEQYNHMFEQVKEMFKNGDPSCPGCVVAGILGIIAAGAAGASQFLPEKK